MGLQLEKDTLQVSQGSSLIYTLTFLKSSLFSRHSLLDRTFTALNETKTNCWCELDNEVDSAVVLR